MTNKDGPAHSRLRAYLVEARVLTLALLIAWQAGFAAETTTQFDLPVQGVHAALREFARQSGVQTLFGYDDSEKEDLDALRTTRVVGEFTAAEALTKMLEGTGLRFRFYAPGKFVVSRPTPSPPAQPVQRQSAATAPGSTAGLAPIDEIYVTGTRVRGALDVVSPTLILPQRELRRTTFATVQDALYSLPINSLSGPREDRWDVGGNTGFGAGINLRHLGPGATLVLVNGQRQPASGEEAAFTDVSNIPWSAVERIELVPDGNSALYGSDAIAGVVNIIMREHLDGAESQARFTTVGGGADELQASQLFGKQWTSGHGLFAYQFAKRAPLDAADRVYAANMDKRRFGGTDHRTLFAGNIIDAATLQPVFGIPASGIETAADYSPDINLANEFEQLQLLAERQTHNGFLTITQALGERWSIRVDGRYGVRDTRKRDFPISQFLVVPQSNPFFVDPFPDRQSQNVIVAHSYLDDLGPTALVSTTRTVTGAASATAALGNDWRLVLSHAQGREALRRSRINVPNFAAVSAALDQSDPAKAFNPFGLTNPDVITGIRDAVFISSLSTITTTSAIADGTIELMAAGPARLALGTEYRRELFQRTSGSALHPETASIANQRYVGSMFVEAAAPLIGNPRDSHAAPRLEFTAAGRFENYSDFGHTFNSRMGMKWAPLDTVKLRGSWGRSFRAPTLVDRDTSINLSGIVSLVDPKSPSGRSTIVGLQGNSPDVQEETATTWTAGLDFLPSTVPGLRFSLTYFDVDYGDRIVTPARNEPFEILLHEEQWGSIINRHPTQPQIDAICQRADFFGPGTCADAQPSIIIDFRKTNLSQTKVRGLDADIGGQWESGVGSWDLQLTGSYLVGFTQRDSVSSPAVDVLNTVFNPPALRARASGEWNQHPASGWAAAAAIHYTSGFRDADSAFVTKVRPWMTVDLQFSYRTAKRGWLGGLELMLNAVNVFNISPPFVDRSTGYDVANAQPIGRTISLEVRKGW